MKRGRKSDVIAQLENTPIIEVVCAKIGISRQTHYRWLKEDPEYAKAVHKALAEGMSRMSDIAETQLVNLIKKGQLGAVIYWLRHRHPAYANRLEISGKVEIEEPLSPEEDADVNQGIELEKNILKLNEKKK